MKRSVDPRIDKETQARTSSKFVEMPQLLRPNPGFRVRVSSLGVYSRFVVQKLSVED